MNKDVSLLKLKTMLYLIIWVLCAIWGYNIMKNKGQDGTLGAVLGGLLGVVGIIICACIPAKSKD